jgi:hypothetical protein
MHTHTCKHCQKEFKTERSTRIYCSNKCIGKQKTKEAIDRRPLSSCYYCGRRFKAKRFRGQKFCSSECLSNGSKTGNWKSETCKYCKSPFMTRFLHLVHCSVECRTKSRRLNRVQNWKANFGKIETLSMGKLQDVRDS